MVKLSKKIEDVMYERNHDIYPFFKSFLKIISWVYEFIVRLRNTLYKKNILKTKKLPCILISIGNITVGGTGKTPVTIYVAKLVEKLGYKVAVISRGYKGRFEKHGGIVSDGKKMCVDAVDAGDEPFMIASKLKTVPVVVGGNRFKAGSIAVKTFSPDVIVLDDAFQHLKLARDINLILLDYVNPFGNNFLLPRGVLREPISSLLRSDGIIFTRSDAKGNNLQKKINVIKNLPVFKSFHKPYLYKIVPEDENMSIVSHRSRNDLKWLNGKGVVVFSGIARNDDFFNTVQKLGCNIKKKISFIDHCSYSDKDIASIFNFSKEVGADCIVTTEKDYMRIINIRSWPVMLVVIGIEVSFDNDKVDFHDFIKQRLSSFSV